MARGIGHVARLGNGDTVTQGRRGGFRRGPVDVCQNDSGALCHEGPSDGQADPLGATGDHGDLALQ